MASIKEIRNHIKSVEQTLKITNAMYLISSSNMRKARRQLGEVEPYFSKVRSTIGDILHHAPDFHHRYFDRRPDVREHQAGYLVITGDKGLAGAYNHNVLRLAEAQIAKTPNHTLFLVGSVGRAYFAHKRVNVDGEFMYAAQDPTDFRAREIAETFLTLFERGRLDEFYVIYTEPVSPLRLEPRVMKLLPLDRDEFPFQPLHRETYYQTVSYVPSKDAVLSQLVPACLRGMIFGALVESYCSEQNARMTAMDSATKNAKEVLRELGLLLNRARQSAITQEITEIVSGARGAE